MAYLAPGEAYRTPDEATERGVQWKARPGEPDDLRDPYHYQTPAEARSLGRDWATQDAFLGGRGPQEHAGLQRMAQEARRAGRLSDLIGYGYDDYTGPLGRYGAPLVTTRPVRDLASLLLPAPAPLTFFSRR